MIYLSTNQDKTVSIITLFPTKIIRQSDGAEMEVLGQRRIDPRDDQPGQCIIYGRCLVGGDWLGLELAVGDENFDIADLKEDSLPDYTIVFPDPEKDVIAKWTKSSQEQVTEVKPVEKSEIPEDRYFRDAWVDNGQIEVDMDKAKTIRCNHLRKERAPLLQQLDVAYFQADEINDIEAKTLIATQKQQLRDMSSDSVITEAKTPDELKEARPAIFGEVETNALLKKEEL